MINIMMLYGFVALFMLKVLSDIKSRYPWAICVLIMISFIWKEEISLLKTADGIFSICIINFLIMFLTVCFLILSEEKYKRRERV